MAYLSFIGKPHMVNAVAVSGGVDSMVLLHFLSQCHKVTVLHYNHGTAHGEEAEDFVKNYCEENNIEIQCDKITGTKPARTSLEEWWRNERYKFLCKYDGTVATAHHLNDAAETYVFNNIHGNAKVIPYSRDNIVRPLLKTKKEEILNWANEHNVPYIDDPSNNNNNHPRNRIRNIIMDEILAVNPGFLTNVRKKIEEPTHET